MSDTMKFSGGGKNTQGGDGPRRMFKAVCATCGKQCEVPFKPSEDRPVYCKDCFRARSPITNRFVMGRSERGAPTQGGALAASFSSRPFSQGAARSADALAAQLALINTKLDRLLARGESAAGAAPKAAGSARKKTAPRRKPSKKQ